MTTKDLRFAENPFFVLGLAHDTSREDVERQGAKLLAQLQIGAGSVATYTTPFGARPRTPELVREALARLRDGDARLQAELWARAGAEEMPAVDIDSMGLPEAFVSAGLRR